MGIHSTTWPSLACDIGKRRSNNEDYALACEPNDEALASAKGCLYIVADGIGGGAAGEVASRFAAEAVAHHYYQRTDIPEESLKAAIAEANSAVHSYAHSHPRFVTMGTTIVAAAIHHSTLYLAHVGDSRAYLLRQHEIQRLTQDHSLARQLARSGILTDAQAERHPHRNVLTRAVGGEKQVLADVSRTALMIGDCLLLCSDGLTGHISDREIGILADASTPDQTAASLIELANERGGQDNITVIVVRWGIASGIPKSLDSIRTEPPPLPDIDQIQLLTHRWATPSSNPLSQRDVAP